MSDQDIRQDAALTRESASKVGLSGALAKKFLNSEITPLLALVGLLLGFFAVIVTPREEEPQIDVTFANVFIAFPGASAKEVESLITQRAEQVVAQIDGLDHVYSISQPGMAILTVQFKVGQARNDALVRLYNALYSNQDMFPANLGVQPPLIKPKGINDVPIVALTLWSPTSESGSTELLRVARTLETELLRIPGARDITTIGGAERTLMVNLDPQKLAGYGLALGDIHRALGAANASADAGTVVTGNREILVQAGTFLEQTSEVAQLVVGVKDGKPIFLEDVASVRPESDHPMQYVQFGIGEGAPAGQDAQAGLLYPAVTLAIDKKPGVNAVSVADEITQRLQELKGTLIPDDVQITVTRNYGTTAADKAKKLIQKLLFATTLVILLVLFTLGWREAIVVGAAVIITLTITLFASWAWGFTLNRVSLFALIFSIGILVDDAIVVVENIHRHHIHGGLSLREAIPVAVDEVGGPTILATFTVIAALLPMAFVTGLMGPYMSPIPINASMGMLISLLVAFIFTPWLAYKLFKRHHVNQEHSTNPAHREDSGLHSFFRKILTPFLRQRTGRFHRIIMLASVLLMIGGSVFLAVIDAVVLKMLPFDNKSEFQVVVDMPEGTPLEQTSRVLAALGAEIAKVAEVSDYQTYAGTASPVNFNGLVRQYYLRNQPYQGDIQVNLVDKHLRDRQSHQIAAAMREPLQSIGKRFQANIKIVEVPPGPPVMSPLVAEVYGPDDANRERMARIVREAFDQGKDIVDTDDSQEAAQERLLITVDRQRAAQLGLTQKTVVEAVSTVLNGADMSYLHDNHSRRPTPVRLRFNNDDQANLNQLESIQLRADNGELVALGEVAHLQWTKREQALYHKDGLPVIFVTGDMAGKLDSPLYGMAEIYSTLEDTQPSLTQMLIHQPNNPVADGLKWDGEWQITYETFRDMGIAYSVGLVLIYLLVVAQFRSYSIPLIIMAPIPLTLIGIMPGHAMLDRQFTATSMIGMIALAGIIVRNSILLVDHIREQLAQSIPLQSAVINASAVRARPIILTALAAMLGAFFILDDPIFSGLAVSLIFGILVSTALTLVVIPVVYYAYHYGKHD